MEAYIIVQVIGILFILLAGIYAVFSSDADSRKRGYIISARNLLSNVEQSNVSYMMSIFKVL